MARKSPAYSLGGRRPTLVKSESPGPGAYSLDQSVNTQRGAPSYTLTGRSDPKISIESPGPGTYASK
jgi:hypothetical protein